MFLHFLEIWHQFQDYLVLVFNLISNLSNNLFKENKIVGFGMLDENLFKFELDPTFETSLLV